jgi:hypothetical protein
LKRTWHDGEMRGWDGPVTGGRERAQFTCRTVRNQQSEFSIAADALPSRCLRRSGVLYLQTENAFGRFSSPLKPIARLPDFHQVLAGARTTVARPGQKGVTQNHEQIP